MLITSRGLASVDYATDALVQAAIASLHDTTILTIAHRLETVMRYDRIMVLDAGRLQEFDEPRELLKREGLLRSLVNAANDREHLEQLAEEGPRRE